MRLCPALVLAVSIVACDRSPEPEQASPEPPAAPEAKSAALAASPPPASAPDPEPPPAPGESAKAPASAATAPTAKAAATSTKNVKPASSASAASAPPPKKVTTVAGSGASGEGFRLSIQAPSPVQAGKSAAAVVVLSAVAPYHCNEKYPYKLVLDPPAASVSYPQQTVRGMAVGKERSSMSVPFSAVLPGSATIAGQLSFSVCTDDKCLIEKRRVSVTLQVD